MMLYKQKIRNNHKNNYTIKKKKKTCTDDQESCIWTNITFYLGMHNNLLIGIDINYRPNELV